MNCQYKVSNINLNQHPTLLIILFLKECFSGGLVCKLPRMASFDVEWYNYFFLSSFFNLVISIGEHLPVLPAITDETKRELKEKRKISRNVNNDNISR